MGWLSSFFTTMVDTDTGKTETVRANVHVNDEGHVTDFIHHTENDASGGQHGHVWGLDSPNDSDIGGRPER